jgi:type II secretory pathway component GspD/PulD (secretin)
MANCPIKPNIKLQSLTLTISENLMLLNKKYTNLMLFIFALAAFENYVFAADANQPIRVRIFSMRTISAQQAKDFLAQCNIFNSVIIPGTNAVSVTANPTELVYASNVLKVVDTNEPYEVKYIELEGTKTLADPLTISTQLGKNYSVGSLLEGTGTSQPHRIIVDRSDDEVMIVSPKTETQNVIKAINETALPESANEEVKPAVDTNIAPVVEPNIAEPNLLPPPPIAESNGVKAKKDANDIDALSEFMDELSQGAKADKEAARQQKIKEAEKLTEDVNVAKPTQKEAAGTEEIALTPEANEIEKQMAEQLKKPAINEINTPNWDEVLELNLPEQLEIVTLIDLVGRYLNLNYLYDPAKVAGTVNIKVQGKIRVGDLYSLLESVLKFKQLAMSRKDNLVTIVPVAEALDQDPVLVDGTVKPGDIAVTKIFRLKYINTETAKNLLIQMKLGSNNITSIPEIGTLVITDYAFRMQRIEDLLNLVDVPGPPKNFKLRVLKYTLAESLITKIKALAEQLGTVEITVGASAAGQEAGNVPGRITRPTRPVNPAAPGAQPSTESATKGVYVDSDKRTNRVLMIGLPSDLEAVDKIIDSLDVPQKDLRTIREYEIQFIDIQKIVDALKEMNIIEGAVSTTTSSTSRRPSVTRPGGDTVPQPTINQPGLTGESASGVPLLDQPQVVMLESTNSLLVNATPEQHIQISQIISYIDREPVEAAIPYRIYRLENQDPEELAETLNGLIGKTVTDAQGKIQETVKYTEENIVIVPDKNTFSLVVYASKKNQEWIGNLIKSLDRRRPQVLIDVSLVEITREDQFNYDLDIVANATDKVANVVQVDPINTATGTHLEGRVNKGDLTGFYSNNTIQALLELVDKKGYGRVLARPKVLVNDSEKGTISTEDTRYIASIQTTALAGQTQTSSVQSSVSFNPYTAKIQLDITPQISEGKLLRLEIKMERNDFQGNGSTITLADGTTTQSPPNEKKSSVDTIVTVPDGSTIILGGLTKLGQNKNTTKVPVLGDVPVAGTLFRNAEKIVNDSKLYIFVKANILRPEQTESLEELRRISEKNRAEFEKDEATFQSYELFPGIKEEPIDPNKVLEQ